jgi:hypothetical protein
LGGNDVVERDLVPLEVWMTGRQMMMAWGNSSSAAQFMITTGRDAPTSFDEYYRGPAVAICPRTSPPGKSPGPVSVGGTPSFVWTLT